MRWSSASPAPKIQQRVRDVQEESALAGAGARDANIVAVSGFRLDSALASVEAI